MAHTLYALVTRNMERIYPQRAAFRWYDEASGTVAPAPMPSTPRISAGLSAALLRASQRCRASESAS